MNKAYNCPKTPFENGSNFQTVCMFSISVNMDIDIY